MSKSPANKNYRRGKILAVLKHGDRSVKSKIRAFYVSERPDPVTFRHSKFCQAFRILGLGRYKRYKNRYKLSLCIRRLISIL